MRPAPAAARARARWTPSPDAQLVELVKERNMYAFELIYLRHAAAVFGLARRIVRKRSIAEAVTQDVFMSVWRTCDRYQPHRGTVRSWLLGITHDLAIDKIRSRSAQDRLAAPWSSVAAPAPRGTTTTGQGASLINSLDSDPSSTRRAGP